MPTGLLPWPPNDSVQMREMAHRSVPNWLELAAFTAHVNGRLHGRKREWLIRVKARVS